jgi:hypothetical protein
MSQLKTVIQIKFGGSISIVALKRKLNKNTGTDLYRHVVKTSTCSNGHVDTPFIKKQKVKKNH